MSAEHVPAGAQETPAAGGTAGPWEVFYRLQAPTKGRTGDDVLGVGKGGVRHDRGEGICSMWGSGDELIANARLTAAAPDLYGALAEMIQAYWRGSEDSDDEDAPHAVKLALTALAKARGA